MAVWKLKFNAKISIAHIELNDTIAAPDAPSLLAEIRWRLPDLVADGVRPKWLKKRARKLAEGYTKLSTIELIKQLADWWNTNHIATERFHRNDIESPASFVTACEELGILTRV